jgi:hypothetical protein
MQLNSYLKGDEYRQNILVNKIKYIVTTTKKKHEFNHRFINGIRNNENLTTLHYPETPPLQTHLKAC